MLLFRMSIRRKPRKVEISNPMNFEHRIHAGFDPVTGQYHGLPKVEFCKFNTLFVYIVYNNIFHYFSAFSHITALLLLFC